MTKGNRGDKKTRYGVALGQLIRRYFDTPPYKSPHLGGSDIWTPELFSFATGVSDSAVRQWLRGDSLPSDSMAQIVRELFGPKRNEFAKEIEELWKLFRQCQQAQTEGVTSARKGNAAVARKLYRTNDDCDDRSASINGLPRKFGDLQEPPTYFLGRDEDVRRVRETLLGSEGPVAILVHGIAGIGKTTLTRAVAYDPAVMERFGDRRWFAALGSAKSSEQMEDAIAIALGGDRTEGLTKAISAIGERPGLLILDNLETPWESKGERQKTEAVLSLLSKIPGLALLASFRGTERISRPIWTLTYPLGQLARGPSEELFCRISLWKDRDDPVFNDFITDLDGLPLAIELVAHRAFQAPNLESMWRRWKEIGARFAVIPDLAPDHVTSLAVSIELSLESPRMNDGALRLFGFLGRCAAGLAYADQQALLGDLAYDASEALRRVGLAVGDADRIDLLSPIRHFAMRERSLSSDDDNAWITHFLELARASGEAIGTVEGRTAIDRLVPEFANFEAAISVALDLQRRDLAMSALPGFERLAYTAGLPSQALRQLANACAIECDLLGEANCFRALGDIAFHRFEHDAARISYEKALSLYRKSRDLQGEANCIIRLGDIAIDRSDNDTARSAYDEALPLYRQIGDLLGEANCIKSLGKIAIHCCDYETARMAYERALSLYRKSGDLQGEANCILHLGDIAFRRFDHDTARKAYDEALPLCREIGDLLCEANCIERLADIAFRRFDHDTARNAYEEARSLHGKIGSLLGEANCITSLGDIAVCRCDYDSAHAAYVEALSLYRKSGSVLGEANCIMGFGNIALERSDHETARVAYDEALPIYRKIGNRRGEADCIVGLGNIALDRSDHKTARVAYDEALSIYRKIGHLLGEANCIAHFGGIALRDHANDAADVEYHEALSIYRGIGDLLGEADCIQGLGDVAHARCDQEAARTTYEDALAIYRKIGSSRGEAEIVQRLKQLRGS